MTIVFTGQVGRLLIQYIQTNGRQENGLYQLSVHLGISYPNAHRVVRQLEQQGVLHVEHKGPGKPMTIDLATDEDK